MNKKYGNIFDINIKSNQYKVTKKEECNKPILNKFEMNMKEIEIKNEDNENEQCFICYDNKSIRVNPKLQLCS